MKNDFLTKFNALNAINLADKIEKKKTNHLTLSYLSWSFAIERMTKECPDWTYKIRDFNGLPYQYDDNVGYLVWTEITANEQTKVMWLPVMDSSSKAMKSKPYTYKVKGVNKEVASATMTDINKTIMRCLVKNMAMFGLGLYIYAGEDLPCHQDNPLFEKLKQEMSDAKTILELNKIGDSIKQHKEKKREMFTNEMNIELGNIYKNRKEELEN